MPSCGGLCGAPRCTVLVLDSPDRIAADLASPLHDPHPPALFQTTGDKILNQPLSDIGGKVRCAAAGGGGGGGTLWA